MRVQIAKYECPEVVEKHQALEKFDSVIRGIKSNCYNALARDSRCVYEVANERSVVYVCKSCGAELYGAVMFPNIYNAPISDLKSCKEHCAKYHWQFKSEAEHQKAQEILDEALVCATEERELAQQAAIAARAEYEKAENIEKCPICGAQLIRDKGYFLPDVNFWEESHKRIEKDYWLRSRMLKEEYGFDFLHFKKLSTYAEKFKAIIPFREEKNRAQAKADANAYVKSFDLFVAANVPAKTSEIKGNLDLLKQYILHLIRLENIIYSLEQQLPELYYQRLYNNPSVVLSVHEPAYRIRMELEELRAVYQEALEAASAAETYQPDTVHYPSAPAQPVLGKPGLFNKKKVLEENEALTAKYQAEMEAYQNECKRCDEEKARLIAEFIDKAQKNAEEARERMETAERSANDNIEALKARPTPAKAIKEMLDKEIAEAEDLLKKTYAARNELYGYDIIFGKYRDVVSLSSFYEYLMSGRCASLEGADGAYNIYESEIRANRVIAQLDTVISSLEDIKQNQYMMYQELRSINSSLDSLNDTMGKALTSIRSIEDNTAHIAQNSDVIAHNTAVTAYYSKVNAELTNALGFMVALK